MSVSEYPALYSGQIRQLLQKDDIDLATITTKLIRKQLENDFNVHFSTKEEKKAINDLIRRIYDEVTEQSEEEESEEEGTEEKSYGLSDDEYVDSIKNSKSDGINHTNLVSSEEEMNSDSVDSDVYDDVNKAVKAGDKRKRKTKTKTKAKAKKTKRKPGSGGLNAPLILSEKLGKFLGAEQMSRTEIVKNLWAYIKENDLQDPADKRFILSDSKLKNVFGVDRFSGFSMNKLLNDHLTKLDGTSCKKEKTEEEEKAEKEKKAARKKAGGRGKASKADKPKKAAPNNGFNKPMLLSPVLSSFLNNQTELPRPQVVKQIWEYIKEKKLQDESDKRYILCDDNLFSIFKTKRVHMFQMNKILAEHLKSKDDVVDVKEEANNIKLED
ncbi:SWIB-domain-containing protein [Neocallimastix lanati (nom. inval.)]|jgi:upstream activation factor subunit UAF30|uniref:SWIB-domain-containing protein n=1 Tax=Neocallimastix californiae TaxID=1754190 RepID=A0A1Y2EZA1_9FUNG|nr:SWIB-domain-containing protein [Neocallimastix sp. JGI-2020a]ORY76446.1 SWIB-domain-containing protein [Neocallimastix californiae]|eukprot:ORY76446.1 SWIB-domain-containing protein [Neocallimastix californiae]